MSVTVSLPSAIAMHCTHFDKFTCFSIDSREGIGVKTGQVVVMDKAKKHSWIIDDTVNRQISAKNDAALIKTR